MTSGANQAQSAKAPTHKASSQGPEKI